MPNSRRFLTNQEWQAKLDLLKTELQEIEAQVDHLRTVDPSGRHPVPIGCHPIAVRPPDSACEILRDWTAVIETCRAVENLTGTVCSGFRDLRLSLLNQAEAEGS